MATGYVKVSFDHWAHVQSIIRACRTLTEAERQPDAKDKLLVNQARELLAEQRKLERISKSRFDEPQLGAIQGSRALEDGNKTDGEVELGVGSEIRGDNPSKQADDSVTTKLELEAALIREKQALSMVTQQATQLETAHSEIEALKQALEEEKALREAEKAKECLEELPLLLADLEFKLRDTVNERNCLADLVSPSTELLANYAFKADNEDQLSFSKDEVLSVIHCGLGGWWQARTKEGREGLIPCNAVRRAPGDTRHSPGFRGKSRETEGGRFFEALYSFSAAHQGQLAFSEGDILEVFVEHESGWSFARDLVGRKGLVPQNFLRQAPYPHGESESLPLLSFWLQEASSLRSRVRQLQLEAKQRDQNMEHAAEELQQQRQLLAQTTAELQRQMQLAAQAATELRNQQQINATRVPERRTSLPLPTRSVRYFYQALYDFRGERPQHLSFKQGDELQVLQRDSSGWCLARHSDGRSGLIPGNYVQLSCDGALVAHEDDAESLDLLLLSGCIATADNRILYPDGSRRDEHGRVILGDGCVVETVADSLPDGCVLLESGCFRYPSGAESNTEGLLQQNSIAFEPLWRLPPRACGKVYFGS